MFFMLFDELVPKYYLVESTGKHRKGDIYHKLIPHKSYHTSDFLYCRKKCYF